MHACMDVYMYVCAWVGMYMGVVRYYDCSLYLDIPLASPLRALALKNIPSLKPLQANMRNNQS